MIFMIVMIVIIIIIVIIVIMPWHAILTGILSFGTL